MYTLTRGEYLDSEVSLDVAIHQLGMGRHHALLVTETHLAKKLDLHMNANLHRYHNLEKV